jgi:predicted Zn-dependent protease
MELPDWLIISTGSAALSAVTWGISHWWYGRRIADAEQRLEKSEKAHQFASLQVTQARKQIERLQKELAAQHQKTVQLGARADQLHAVLRAGDAAAERSAVGRAALPVDGFADTEPMETVHR